MSPDAPERRRVGEIWVALSIAALAAGAFLLRFGYRFGYSDQDEFLPWLQCRLSGGVSPVCGDWFVGLQQASVNVRTGFVYLLQLPSSIGGIEASVALLYALCWLAIGSGTYVIARRIAVCEPTAILSTLLALAGLYRWTLGGNEVVATMLVPSMLAWALCIWALVFALAGRRLALSGLLVGLAAWFQLLVAFWTGFGIVILLGAAGIRSLRDLARFALPAVFIALPIAVLLTAGRFAGGPDLYELMANFRAPHHYVPSSFPPSDYAKVGILLAAGVAGLLLTQDDRSPGAQRGLLSLVLASAAVPLLLGALSEWRADWALAALQPFKLTVLSKLILVPAGLAGGAHLLRRLKAGKALSERFSSLAASVTGSRTWLALIWLLAAACLGNMPAHAPGAGVDVGKWAAGSAPRAAVFAVPPSFSGFRLAAQRPVMVTFKAYPFEAGAMAEWLARLDDASGATVPRARRPAGQRLQELDAAWESRDGAGLLAYLRLAGATHAVRRTPLRPDSGTLELVASVEGYHVYHLISPDAP